MWQSVGLNTTQAEYCLRAACSTQTGQDILIFRISECSGRLPHVLKISPCPEHMCSARSTKTYSYDWTWVICHNFGIYNIHTSIYNTCIPIFTYTYIHTYMSIHVQTYILVHTYNVNTHTHIYIHMSRKYNETHGIHLQELIY